MWFKLNKIRRKRVLNRRPFRRNETKKTVLNDKKVFKNMKKALQRIEKFDQEIIMIDESIFSHRNF